MMPPEPEAQHIPSAGLDHQSSSPHGSSPHSSSVTSAQVVFSDAQTASEPQRLQLVFTGRAVLLHHPRTQTSSRPRRSRAVYLPSANQSLTMAVEQRSYKSYKSVLVPRPRLCKPLSAAWHPSKSEDLTAGGFRRPSGTRDGRT